MNTDVLRISTEISSISLTLSPPLVGPRAVAPGYRGGTGKGPIPSGSSQLCCGELEHNSTITLIAPEHVTTCTGELNSVISCYTITRVHPLSPCLGQPCQVALQNLAMEGEGITVRDCRGE